MSVAQRSAPGEERAPAALLHNMSCRPTAAATRQGEHCARLVRVPVADILAEHRVTMPAGSRPASSSVSSLVAQLCQRAGVRVAPGSSPEDALDAWVDRTLDAASFPAVAALVRDASRGVGVLRRTSERELAIAIAVATRGSDKVFLRAKSPRWSRLAEVRSVVLVLPPAVRVRDDAKEEA